MSRRIRPSALGRDLRVAREKLGLTLREMAKRANQSISQLSKLERGTKTSASREDVRLIASAYNVELLKLQPLVEREPARAARPDRSNDLIQADFRNGNLEDEWLPNANLAFARLEHAKLCRAHLDKADLSFARLYHTDLDGAVLSKAKLWGAQLMHVVRAESLSACEPGAFFGAARAGDLDRPGKLQTEFSLKRAPVVAVSYNPATHLIASAHADGTVRVWTTPGGQSVRTMLFGRRSVVRIAWAPDGRSLAVATTSWRREPYRLPTSTQSGRAMPDCAVHLRSVDDAARDPEDSTSAGRLHFQGWIAGLAWVPEQDRSRGTLSMAIVSANADESAPSPALVTEIAEWDGVGPRKPLFAVNAVVLAMAWRSDGRSLVLACHDGSLRLIDRDGAQRGAAVVERHTTRCAVAWSPREAEAVVLTAGQDNFVRVRPYDESSARFKTPMVSFKCHATTTFTAAWSPRGDMIATGGDDSTPAIWDSKGGERLADLHGQRTWIGSLDWQHRHRSEDSRSADRSDQLATGSDDGTVHMWQVQRRADDRDLLRASSPRKIARELAVLAGLGHNVWSVAWHPHSDNLASASDDKTVRIWALPACSQRNVLPGMRRSSCVAWSPSGNSLAAAYDDGALHLWRTDAVASSPISVKQVTIARAQDNPAGIWKLCWHPSGHHVAVGGADGMVRIYDHVSGKQLTDNLFARGEDDPGISTAQDVRDLAWSPDGLRLATVTIEGKVSRVCVWAWDQMRSMFGEALVLKEDEKAVGEKKAVGEEKEDAVRSLAWHPSGDRLALGTLSGTVSIWDLSRCGRETIAVKTRHRGGVASLAWSLDGKLASGGRDGAIQVWPTVLTSPDTWIELVGHACDNVNVAWRSDGRTLASGGGDGTIRIWNVERRENVAVLLPALRDGWAAVDPRFGKYKHEGDGAEMFWHRIGLCTFLPRTSDHLRDDDEAKKEKAEPNELAEANLRVDADKPLADDLLEVESRTGSLKS